MYDEMTKRKKILLIFKFQNNKSEISYRRIFNLSKSTTPVPLLWIETEFPPRFSSIRKFILGCTKFPDFLKVANLQLRASQG